MVPIKNVFGTYQIYFWYLTKYFLVTDKINLNICYEANIYYDDQHVGESHKMLDGEPWNMYNTYEAGTPSDWVTLETVNNADAWKSIQRVNGWGANKVTNKIRIAIKKSEASTDAMLLQKPDASLDTGYVPQMILVPGDWNWPRERVSIIDAYPGFKDWSGNAQNFNWQNSKVADKVINR